MIKSGDKQLVVYNDDYKPVNVYGNRKKIAGYKEVELSGKHIEVEDTYNDVLDVKVQGHHEQDSRKAYWWNQLAKAVPVDKSGVSVTNNGNIYTCSGECSNSEHIVSNPGLKFIKDHKYYYYWRYSNYPVLTDGAAAFQIYDASNAYGYVVVSGTTLSGTSGVKDGIITALYNASTVYYRVRIQQGKDYTGLVLYPPMIFDLTAMFGAGKEPTAEQFRKMFPCDYYPYNAGEWRYASGGQYVNFNQKIKCGLQNVWRLSGFQDYSYDPISNTETFTAPTENNKYVCNLTHRTVDKNKYLIAAIIKNNSSVFITLRQDNGSYPESSRVPANSDWQFTHLIYTAIGANYAVNIRPSGNNAPACSFSIKNPICINLTQMFGEGNEPTTIEEFKALYPNEYYEYVESRYEYTPGYYENGEVVEHIPDTAFDTPMPELPEEVKCVKDANINVSSKAVMWNQLAQDLTAFRVTYGNRIEVSSNYIKCSQNHKTYGVCIYTSNIYNTNNLILIIANINIHSNNDKVGSRILVNSREKVIKQHIVYDKNVWSLAYGFYRPVNNPNGQIQIGIGINGGYAKPDDDDWFEAKNVQCFDLTLMFGAGNEPQTVEEFKAMFPKDYYPYDAGTLRTIKGLKEIVPTSTEIPFELYGANGINDEVEPCVLVDGEWKCRVTRRWRRLDFSSITKVNPWGSKGAIFINNNEAKRNSITIYSSHLRSADNPTQIWIASKQGVVQNEQYNQIGFYINGFTEVAQYQDFFANTDGYILYQLETPTIELYDPIPVRTLPINSVIDCDAEMEANVKVVDKEL